MRRAVASVPGTVSAVGLALILVVFSVPEGFSSIEHSTIKLNGHSFKVQNGGTPWAVAIPEPNRIRFEVRPGDRWQWDAENKERSEISNGGANVFAPGEVLNVRFKMMVEPGQVNTANWFVAGQFHADDTFTSPPFAIELVGDKMAIVVRNNLEGPPKEATYVYVDKQNIRRGRYYEIRITVNFENNQNGYLNVWRDGAELAAYRGPLGYGYGVYWKQGIYRQESDEIIAINYKDFSLETAEGSDRSH